MSVLNPQSMVSSRLHTNNHLRDNNDSRKLDTLQRDKVIMDLNSIKIHTNNHYEVVEGRLVDESKNLGSMSSSNKAKLESQKSHEQFDSDKFSKKDSIIFDDRILRTRQSSVYITFNRLLYSKNCVYFYIGLIVFSVIVLLYSIYGLFAKLGKHL